MVNEKEFKKYIKHSYNDKPKTKNYFAILMLACVIAAVFFSITSIDSKLPILDARIRTEEDAMKAATEITESFVDANLILDDLDSIADAG